MNIFVANLNPHTTGDELNKLFSAYGSVTSAKIIYDKETGNSKRYGFVEMSNDDEAKQAIAALHESHLNENVITVRESIPSNRQSGGFNKRNQKPFYKKPRF